MPDLYPYQETGRDFLAARRRAYLADRPGLGKTAQAIRAAAELGRQRVLVVCPAAAVPVWEGEWEKWSGRGELGVLSYSKLIRTTLRQRPDVVILDEAHYCKNPNAKRTKAALELAAEAERAWLLSGSPMPNDPRELYPPFAHLWPERMPNGIHTAYEWMNFFCRWSLVDYGGRRKGYKVWGSKNAATLRRMLDGIMLRRRLQDVALELPPLRVYVEPLTHNAEFAKRIKNLPEGLETTTGRRLLGEHKAPRIAKRVIEEMKDERAYDAVVLMYHHRDTGALLRRKLEEAGIDVYGFDGSTPQGQRGREVEMFQSSTAPSAFVVQQQAGGTAITLTRAHELVLVEPDWSPEVNAQAILRVHRISQESPTRARLFAVDGSLDQGVMASLARKTEMRKEIIDGEG